MKIVLLPIILALTGCSVYAPDAGHEVVLVDKPWFFGHGGVESEPVKTGRSWAALTTEGDRVAARALDTSLRQV